MYTAELSAAGYTAYAEAYDAGGAPLGKAKLDFNVTLGGDQLWTPTCQFTLPGVVEVSGYFLTDVTPNTGRACGAVINTSWIPVPDTVVFDASKACTNTVAGSQVNESGTAKTRIKVSSQLGQLVIEGDGTSSIQASVMPLINGVSSPHGTVMSRVEPDVRFVVTADSVRYTLSGSINGTLSSVLGIHRYQRSTAVMVFRRQGVPCCIAQVSTGATFDAQVPTAAWSSSGWLRAGTYDVFAVLRSEAIVGIVTSASASAGFNFKLTLSP
jgi:hypothetical protein